MDVHSQANELPLFRGLSDECPSVIEDCIQQALNPSQQITVKAVVTQRGTIESPIVVTRVSGWYGIGRERIAKYIAKRAMESNLFDCLLWMIVPQNVTAQGEFQLQVADSLRIPYTRNSNSDELLPDDVLAQRIHDLLSQQKFLLVHDVAWEVEALRGIGIPIILSSGSYSMVLAISTKVPSHHLDVSILSDLRENDIWDLLWEESADIATALSLRGAKITAEGVMKCILYFALVASDAEVKSMPRYWFAEGFFSDNNLDLESIFQYGIEVQEEIQRRGILRLSDDTLYYFQRQVYEKILKVLGSGGFGGPAMIFNSTLVKQGKWLKCDRIFCLVSPDIFHQSPDCSSIRFRGSADYPDDFFKSVQNVRVIYFVKTEVSALPSFLVCFGKTLRLLQFSHFQTITDSQVLYLRTLEKLEVLDLAGTSLENMPDNSFEGLENLRLLDLSGCEKITSLPSSISLLLNLEQLLLGGCCSLTMLPSSLPLQKLQVLDLSRTKLYKIPEFLLQSSKSHLVNLKKLNFSNCSSIEDTSPFSWCLKDMINLRVLDLSSTTLELLSLKGCSNLESIHLKSSIDDLVVLDLSFTKIKQFPLECSRYDKSLRRLDLLGVKNLVNVNWKNIWWLPPQVNWDQFSDGSASRMLIPLDEWFRVGNGDGVFVSVSDANIFRSLTPSSSLWTKSLLRFLIYIHPCMENSPPSLTSTYKDVYSKLQPHIPLLERCLEIAGVEISQKDVCGILSHTTFLYLHDVKNLVKLSNLGVENMGHLKECWLKKCHDVEVVFDVGHNNFPPILSFLEKVWISEMKRLHKVCSNVGILENGSFSQLKHLQLEYCPQLVMVFASGVCLGNLETLEIKHCARVEEIFCGELHSQGSLQRLHTLLLLELPALNNIVRDVPLSSLKSARIKGCPKLRKLPIGVNDSVAITAELQWWEQIEWDDSNRKHQVSFNVWRPFKLHTRK